MWSKRSDDEQLPKPEGPLWPRHGGHPCGVWGPGGERSYQVNRIAIVHFMTDSAQQLVDQAGRRGRVALRERWAFREAGLNFAGRGGWDRYAEMRDAAGRMVSRMTGTEIHPSHVESDWFGLPIGPFDHHPDEHPQSEYADLDRELRRDAASLERTRATLRLIDREAGG